LEMFKNKNLLRLNFIKEKKILNVAMPEGLITFSRANDNSVAFNTINGAYLFNIKEKKLRIFL